VFEVVEVVDVAVPWRAGAGGKDAVPVAGGDRSSLLGGPAFGGVVGVEDPSGSVEQDRGE